jgi:hypothetical protein
VNPFSNKFGEDVSHYAEDVLRADGDCLCDCCDNPYRLHPMSRHADHNGEPYLHRLCDGQLVKL